MSKKKTEVTKVEAPTAPVKFESGDTWGAGDKVDASEIFISKILMLQDNSKIIAKKREKDFMGGMFIDSIEETVLASRDKPVYFIVLDSFKTRHVYEDGVYTRSEPWLPEYSDKSKYPKEGVRTNNVLVRWKEVRHYYVLRPEDIENGTAFPYVVSFKGLGLKSAGKLAKALAKLQEYGSPSAAQVFKLTSDSWTGIIKETGQEGTFWVQEVDDHRFSTAKEVEVAKRWYDNLKVKNVKVDESAKDED